MESVWSGIGWALGLEEQRLTVWQVALRAVAVYIIGVVLVRLGEKRFIGKFTAFDVIMGIMIGSILSRAITTAGDFLSNLAAALALIGLHYAFAALAYHFDGFGNLVKGNARMLINDGQIQWGAMRRAHISEKDLMSALRENANVDEVTLVKQARLERSGNISAILKDD